MDIVIYHRRIDVTAPQGVGVVIDVFRATSTLACLAAGRPEEIRVVGEAHELEPISRLPNGLTFSELTDFGADNSPLVALRTDLRGKVVGISTTNGTGAIRAAQPCDLVLTAAFVNLDAVVDALVELSPRHVSIIASGVRGGREPALEDSLCAKVLKSRLEGVAIDERQVRRTLLRRIRDRKLDPMLKPHIESLADLRFCASAGIIDVVPSARFDESGAITIEPFSG